MNRNGESGRALARMVSRLREAGIRDERVLNAMERIARSDFVEPGLRFNAYEDTPLPIGFQQTISQPYIVARMLEILGAGARPFGRTLEVGAGSGYQAAVLAHLADEVYAVERIRGLLDIARNNLRPLRLPNVRLKHADGSNGLEEAAPFDTIIVAAAAREISPALQAQLAIGGRLLAPLGSAEQHLLLLERTDSTILERRFDAVRFVPLLDGTE